MSTSAGVRIRAGDAERETVAEQLREAHAHGRLRFDELDARLGSAYGATYLDELPALVADLPEPPAAGRPPVPWRPPTRVAPLVLLALVASLLLIATGHPPFPLFWVGVWLLVRRRSGWFRAPAAGGPARTG